MEVVKQTDYSPDQGDESLEMDKIYDNMKVYRETLTTKTAVTFLLEGKLKNNVCRYCLTIGSNLTELDRILHVAVKGVIYNVTVRDMIASFHHIKVVEDPNFPNKICEICLEQALSSYLFVQQCERAERALRNCFDDIYEKTHKLDPIEYTKRRGRMKINPNYNTIYTEHENVIDYAEPIINLINVNTEFQERKSPNESNLSHHECAKCWQVYPNLATLLNHEKVHPSTMWFHCRACGRSFAKRGQLKKHMKSAHVQTNEVYDEKKSFKCQECDFQCTNYSSHIEHIEKHKFKLVMQNVVEGKMDKLCSVCLNRGQLKDLDQIICLHGGSPGLTGDVSLYAVIGSIIPNMNNLHSYTGNKICDKCYDGVLSSYIFINYANNVRTRLNSCITLMLQNLNNVKIEREENVFIEISQNAILNVKDDFDEYLLVNENEEIDESKLKIDVLEDEFRELDDNASSKTDESNSDHSQVEFAPSMVQKHYVNSRKLCNGYQQKKSEDVSEFLTFKKKAINEKYAKHRFCCPVCSKKFITNHFLQKHVAKHLIRKVDCLVCNETFKSKFYLYEHVKITHLLNKDNYFTCTCGRVFTNISKYKTHMLTHGKKECQLCDKIFVSQKHYDNHLFRHAIRYKLSKREKTKYCSFCEKEYSNDNDLSLHVNKAHLQIKPYSCDMCNRQYYTESNLQNHKKLHTLRSKEECRFCNKILKSRHNLVVHIRKHINQKPFKCKVCPDRFFSEKKATRHLKMVHGGVYCCLLCKSVFRYRKDLTEHNNHCNLLSQCY